jgi:hypothetical protein
MLRRLHAALPTLSALGRAAATVGAAAVASFGLAALVLRPGLAAVAGLALFAVALGALRPAGLLGSWRYLRALA